MARVAVITNDGKFGTVDESEAHLIERAGGRVLPRKEMLRLDQQEAYNARSASEKAFGHIVEGAAGALSATAAAPVVGGSLAISALAGTDAVAIRPETEAFHQGFSSAFTGGLDEVAVKKGLELAGASERAKAYGKRKLEIQEAQDDSFTAGQVGGFVTSALAGGPQGLGFSRAGGAAERALAETVGQFAGHGAVGRAVTEAAALGGRGAVEGALYGGAQQVTEDVLGDRELATDKIMTAVGNGILFGGAGGAALGGAGSLLASAGRATRGGLARALGRTERAGGDALPSVPGATAAERAADAATNPTAKGGAVENLIGKGGDELARSMAHDRAWRAAGGRKAFAAEANKYLPNGTDDVGEVFLRHGVIDKDARLIDAAMGGTPEQIAERVAAPLAKTGARLGEIAETSGARVPVKKIAAAVDEVLEPIRKKAGFEHVETSIRNYNNQLFEKLGVTQGKPVTVQDLLFQRKALDELIYVENKALDPSGRVGALRELRGKIESVITEALDEASGKVPGALKAEYNALKHDYQALRIGQKAAEDAVTRGAANRTFSLTDKIVGSVVGGAGAVIGGPLGGLIAGPGAAAASKFVRERGDAVAAVLLHRIADSKALTKVIQRVDEQIGRSAKGLLAPPSKRPLPEPTPTEPVRARAEKAMKRVAEAQSDPAAYVEKVVRQTEALSATSPEVAAGITRRMVDAVAFLSSKVPVSADRDPLDPHPAPRMSEAQAAEFARYAWYTEKPARFFVEVEHGKITHEGAETAKALAPRAFADLQAKTLEAIAAHMAAGRTIPFEQRLKIGTLLDIPADPSQREGHAKFLQGNVLPSNDNGKNSVAPAPKRSLQIPTQQSALDRLEGKGPGHR